MRFTPARRRGVEILDDPSHDPALAVRSLRDVAKANRLFGGRRAVLREVDRALVRARSRDTQAAPQSRSRTPAPERILLDIGTGIGDIPSAAARAAARRGVRLSTIGLELEGELARAAQPACTWALVGDALQLPFADASIDIVTVSQVLHHFEGDAADQLLRECTRVARDAVVVADLRRSWFAVAGLWCSSFVLGFHPVSRNDGVVSILRGYTASELAALVQRATGAVPVVRHALGWRVTAVWARGSNAAASSSIAFGTPRSVNGARTASHAS
ncbi:MAG TPA: methyltransferase domain-containing protein [Gemmatimonas sp.]|nr:methyltransferase domain-containing protein [Gemmatimonas sp.]